MPTLREAIIKSKNKDLYYEEKLQALVREFEDTLQTLKTEAKAELSRVAEDMIFQDLEPAKNLAKKTAQEEIKLFKAETNEKVQSVISNTEKAKNDILQKVENRLDEAHTSFMQEVRKLLAATVKEIGVQMSENDAKLSTLSANAKEEFGGIIKRAREIVESFGKRIETFRGPKGKDGNSGKDGKDGSPDTPEQIADKANTLEERIEQKVIKGLRADLLNIRKSIREKGGSGGGGMGNWVTEAPSGTINGSNTSFTITSNVGGGGKAIILLYQGQVLEYTTHFTVSGKTITMTFAPETGTTLFAMYTRR